MFNWFTKKKAPASPRLTTDIHSHLLPGIDDGVRTLADAEAVILEFQRLGYTRLITSPHVISDAYRNTREGILAKLDELREHLVQRGIGMRVDAIAEYYLDEAFMRMVQADEPLLTCGNRYLLFETNFLTEPFNLKEFIFLASTCGYKPVLAHPERYLYLQNNMEKLQDFLDRGILFQLNISSITGYYSREVQVTAQKLIDRGWVHFLGSDCHHLQHVRLLGDAQRMKYFQKAMALPLLNHTL